MKLNKNRAAGEVLDAIIVSPHVDYLESGFPQVLEADFSVILPLGAMYVAQHLNDRGFKVAFLHIPSLMSQPAYAGMNLEQILAQFPAKICAIQCNWFLYVGGTAVVSETYRRLFPQAQIVAGGIHASTSYTEMLGEIPSLDGVVRGEGELILEKMIQGVPWGETRGLAFRQGAEIKYTAATQEDAVPMKEVSVIDPRLPCFHGIEPESYFYLNVTRGKCAHRCTYCVAHNADAFHRRLEPLPLEKILEQLRVYRDCGVKEIFMGETQFMAKSFLKDLARAIIKEKFEFFFRLETHPMLFDGDTTKLLIDAGFRRFCMGSESGDDGMLSHTGRRYSSATILKAVETIRKHNGIVLTSWIINLPNETQKQYQETLSMMSHVADAGGLVYWVENLFVLPGTPLKKESARFGISPHLNSMADWRRWAVRAKSAVDFEHARENPQVYLTHRNENSSFSEMMERFVGARLHAKNLVPQMIANVMGMDLPEYLRQTEMEVLFWFQQSGYNRLLM